MQSTPAPTGEFESRRYFDEFYPPMSATHPASALRRILKRVAPVALLTVCLGMSVFQVYRATVKAERYDQMQAAKAAAPMQLTEFAKSTSPAFETLNLRKLSLRGTWLPEKTIFLDNKIRNRWVGYHVLTPLQLEGSEWVILVNRGWIKAPKLRSELPQVKSPNGTVELAGNARKFEQRVFELEAETRSGRVWQHVREADYIANSGLSSTQKVVPLIALQTSASDDGLIREWTQPDHPSLHHIGYAVMWFIFALMAGFYGWFLWKRS
jgi:surfeit locus 1 family protein